jgi:hypothetical protein
LAIAITLARGAFSGGELAGSVEECFSPRFAGASAGPFEDPVDDPVVDSDAPAGAPACTAADSTGRSGEVGGEARVARMPASRLLTADS